MKQTAWPLAAALLFTACSADGPTQVGEDPAPWPCPANGGITRTTAGDFGAGPSAPVRRLVLMGGSTEVDPASRHFVEGAGGGDVLVLRATGSTTSYTPYFFAELPSQPRPASVTTIRIDAPASSSSEAVLCAVDLAEAVWLAGGNQWHYLGQWRPSLHAALAALTSRQGTIGGTSAGAVVLGEAAFDAEHGSVTSAAALADPLRAEVSVVLSPLAQPELAGWIVDSHFSERGREGRLLAFLARTLPLTGRDTAYGMGLDERTALVIEDGSYEMMASPDRSVWLYRVDGPIPLVAEEPLNVTAVRVRVRGGERGAWPHAFEGADTVRVVDGVVQNGL